MSPFLCRFCVLFQKKYRFSAFISSLEIEKTMKEFRKASLEASKK